VNQKAANCARFLRVSSWLHGWTDLLSFEVTPVLTDEQFKDVIG